MFRAFVRLALVTPAAGLVASAAASAVVPKVTLTVEVGGQGDGTVVSHPSGLSCPLQCTLRVRKGTRVVLTAKPSQGSQSIWMNACGTSHTCTVTMTAPKTVTIVFKIPQPPPPPPPPPPPAKPGHYTGTYSDGTNIAFDVDSAGANVYNIQFDLNGHCGNGGTSYGNLYGIGPFTIHTDGSFTGSTNITFSAGNGTAVANVAGTFAQSGSASGTIRVDLAFTDGVSCTSTGTWSAKSSS